MPKWMQILLMALLLPLYIVQLIVSLAILPIIHGIHAIRFIKEYHQEPEFEKKMDANNIQKTPAYFAIKPSKRSFFAYWKEGMKTDYQEIWEDITELSIPSLFRLILLPLLFFRGYVGQPSIAATNYILYVGDKEYQLQIVSDNRVLITQQGVYINMGYRAIREAVLIREQNIKNDPVRTKELLHLESYCISDGGQAINLPTGIGEAAMLNIMGNIPEEDRKTLTPEEQYVEQRLIQLNQSIEGHINQRIENENTVQGCNADPLQHDKDAEQNHR